MAHEDIAIWLEGIALVAIFIWDRLDSRSEHKQTIAQLKIAQEQAATSQAAAESVINAERAWVIAELIPTARLFGNIWHRLEPYGHVEMSTEELMAGHHLRYKLKLTNMGRTPAQIMAFAILYDCLGKDVTDLPENGRGERHSDSYRPFELLLAGNGKEIEVAEPVIDVGLYIRQDRDALDSFEKTAVFRGWVKYRHMFSTTHDCYADFCYSYKASEKRLISVGKYTKQRQEKAN